MPRVCTYLNFARETEAAFQFYRSVFRTEFLGPILRFKDGPGCAGSDGAGLPASDADLVMHMELGLPGGHVLMGTDAPASMGFQLSMGNNVHINFEPDTRAEAERLFAALSAGGSVQMPLADMFWGAYFASFTDKFGVHWMINCATKA